jgi:hypothetical protein
MINACIWKAIEAPVSEGLNERCSQNSLLDYYCMFVLKEAGLPTVNVINISANRKIFSKLGQRFLPSFFPINL